MDSVPAPAAPAVIAPRRIIPWRLFVGAFIPNWLLCRPEVSGGAKLAYARLCQFSGRDGLCFPKQSTLAAELGVAERTIRNHLRELEEFQLIEVDQPGLRQSNRYAFLAHPWMADTSGPEPGHLDRRTASGPDRQASAAPDRQVAAGPIGEENQEEENQKTHTPVGPPRPSSLASGFHSLRADGKVFCWGRNLNGECLVPGELDYALTMGAGNWHSLAIKGKAPLRPRAAAVAQVVNGFLVGVAVTATGFGYTSLPAIQVVGGDGTGAVLVPVLENGRVVSITVENPGRGYTSAPQIVIAPPLLSPPSLSITVSRVVVRQRVTPGVTYQLENSRDLQTWSSLGDPFVAETDSEEREALVGDGGLNFRLVEVP